MAAGEGGEGGPFSQFMKNEISNSGSMKIMVHDKINMYFSFHGQIFCKITLICRYYESHDSRGKN